MATDVTNSKKFFKGLVELVNFGVQGYVTIKPAFEAAKPMVQEVKAAISAKDFDALIDLGKEVYEDVKQAYEEIKKAVDETKVVVAAAPQLAETAQS